jgi:DNA/RNA-binding domain of Phe-tRNA-synthetase-like protein
MDVIVSPDLEGKVHFGWIESEGHTVVPTPDGLLAEAATLYAELRERHGGMAPAEIPGVASARALWKALGLDPTKNRPSSEKLLRRVLKGGELPRINSLVDAANLASLRHLLPVGLYDRSALRGGRVEVRVGREGEAYGGIAGQDVHVGGRVCLADAEGAFGNPTADSDRTKVTLETTASAFALFAPATLEASRARGVLTAMGEALLRWSGGAHLDLRLVTEG